MKFFKCMCSCCHISTSLDTVCNSNQETETFCTNSQGTRNTDRHILKDVNLLNMEALDSERLGSTILFSPLSPKYQALYCIQHGVKWHHLI